MTLTKAQIFENITEQNGFPKNQSSKIVEIVLELIKSSLESGEGSDNWIWEVLCK